MDQAARPLRVAGRQQGTEFRRALGPAVGEGFQQAQVRTLVIGQIGQPGAHIEIGHGFIEATAPEGLKGTKIYLDFPSVGATENIIMAASMAEGQTILENPAQEPEIVDLANYLNVMGAKIRGAGTNVIKIDGARKFVGRDYTIIPDRIEAGTYMVAAAMTRGDIYVENAISEHLKPVIAKLKEAGVEIEVQLPEKKRQNLSALSGGERALTVIALLFSFLRYRPSPFSVLDEIDAPLDEANISRFGSFLRDYAAQTQFIIVTHRKGTMEAADAMYGVTIEDAGVSKILSVRLNELEN